MLALRLMIVRGTVAQKCLPGLASFSPLRLTNAQMSSTNLDVSLDKSSGIAVLKMTKKPANSLDKTMLTELSATVESLESDPDCRGLILTSAVPRLFSAGLELFELYQPPVDKFRDFWGTLQDFWLRFYGTRLATVAAINGHSPAGGCLLALCCDYRVMASSKYTIGLNEALLGFAAPPWLMDMMVNTIGLRQAEEALKLGRLFGPEEALKIGLVDEVVTENEVLDAANRAMERYLDIPDISRAMSKKMLRDSTMQKLVVRKREAIEDVVKVLLTKECQERLGFYIKALKERKK